MILKILGKILLIWGRFFVDSCDLAQDSVDFGGILMIWNVCWFSLGILMISGMVLLVLGRIIIVLGRI